jgi:competence protein ComEC
MHGVDRTLPEPQAALLLGVVFGYRSSLPSELQQQMIASGLVHIVVASGLNVALVARLVQQALVRFWRRAARLIALAAISGYTLLSGASPASLRAALMGGLVILGGMLGRRSQIAVAMAMSAALMLAIAPGLIRDVGFQLSFAATLGIVLFADGLVRSTRWLPGPLREPLATTLAAQAMTWPVLVAQVHQLSLIAPLSNLLVVPILPFMMVVGGLGAVAAIIVPIAGWLPLQVAGALAGWVVAVIQLSGGLPFATIRVPYFPASWLALAAILNGGTVAAVKLRQFFWQRPVWIVMLGTALMSAALLVVRPDGRVHVYALDVGTGSAVLIRTSHGHQVLIDGGPDANRLIQAMGRALPPTARTLDFWLISSGRRTEIGAASEVLSRFNVESVVIADPEPWSVSLRSLAQRVDAAGVRVSQIDRVLTIDGVTLRPAADQRTWLISVGASVLAIVPPETSWQSLPSGVDGAIFTAGGPMEWQAPGRGFSVIQVASNSRDGLPVRAVVQRLTGAPVYRTDQIGSVELVQTNAGFRPSLE